MSLGCIDPPQKPKKYRSNPPAQSVSVGSATSQQQKKNEPPIPFCLLFTAATALPLPLPLPHRSARPTKTRQPVATISTRRLAFDASLDTRCYHVHHHNHAHLHFIPPTAASLPPSRVASPWRRLPMRLRRSTASSTRRLQQLLHPIHPNPPSPLQNGSANQPMMAPKIPQNLRRLSLSPTATNHFATKKHSFATTTILFKGMRLLSICISMPSHFTHRR